MNRLKELRKEKKLTQKELAEETDIPYRTLQRWENGESQIKPEKAEKLADYFGVSVGYLLGYDDNDFEKQIRIDTLNDIINQMNRLKELRKEKKLTQKELAEKTDIPYRTLQRWENGESQIKPEKAEKLANFFGVSIAHLLGYDDNDFEKQIRIDTLNDIINQMNRLKELRKEKGLTQTDLAELLEVTKLTIHNWENGVFSIKSDRLKKLCEIFDVDAPYLLGYNNVKNETDIKASVLDEALEKLRAINNMVSVESDEDPNMWTVGFLTAIAAIESFKKEIEAQKDE